MFKNYIITGFRNLKKDKLYTFINIIGLSLGIACCILILLFVQNELSFDKFHTKSDRIFRAWVLEEYNNGEEFFNTLTPFPLEKALETEFSEIEEVVQISTLNWQGIQESNVYDEQLHMVSQGFFNMFDFKPLSGTVEGAFDDVSSIVLSKDTAIKYYGTTDIIGKTLTFREGDTDKIFTVKAVVNNPPTNSSIKFNFLISDLNKSSLFQFMQLENWFSIGAETYVLLSENVIVDDLVDKLDVISSKYVRMSDEGTYTVGLQPLEDIHLNPEFPIGLAPVSNPKYAYILGGIALLILILACINFIMLSISKSTGRAKEVGVRKSVGAQRVQIIQQFLSEAILMVFFSLLVGLILARLFLPTFNVLANKELSLSLNPFLVLVCFFLIIIIGFIAGAYPALVVSNFNPITILKGSFTSGSKRNTFRKALVAFQFTLSMILIASTLIMREQLLFLKNKNLGFDKEQLVSVQLKEQPGGFGGMSSGIKKSMDVAKMFKNKLRAHNEIEKVAATSHTFTGSGWTEISYSDINGGHNEFFLNVVSPNYVGTLGMQIVKGRDFLEDNESDARRAIIVNEAFAEKFNIQNLNGARIPGSNFSDHEIVGIVKDFNYASLHGEVQPLVLTINPSLFFVNNININIFSNPTPKLVVKLKPNQITEGIARLESTWKEILGNEVFEYQFVDEQINASYEQERNLSKIVGIAALFAIIVGSLGLFALASLNIQNRMKELSIRKILGASEQIVLYLVSKEYLIMIAITLLISAPICWYIMSNWLSGFAYRINIGIIYFIVAALIALFTTMVSIGYHAYNALKSQPVDYLRYE